MFINYVENSDANQFLIVKSDVVDCNNIIEKKNVKCFEKYFSFLMNVFIHPLSKITMIPNYEGLKGIEIQYHAYSSRPQQFLGHLYTYSILQTSLPHLITGACTHLFLHDFSISTSLLHIVYHGGHSRLFLNNFI